MTITFSEKDFRAMEDTIAKIRAQAMRARMADEAETRHALQYIVTNANLLTNLLLNGLINEESDAEDVRAIIACPHCGGVDAHRPGCPWA